MTLMCAWQTSGMPIFNHQHPKSITLSVEQSLEWKMLAKWLSCIELSMVEASNIQWNQVMSNFEIQSKVLKERKDGDDPDAPKITKALPIIKWTEAFQDILNWVIGSRMIPLAYVI